MKTGVILPNLAAATSHLTNNHHDLHAQYENSPLFLHCRNPHRAKQSGK